LVSVVVVVLLAVSPEGVVIVVDFVDSVVDGVVLGVTVVVVVLSAGFTSVFSTRVVDVEEPLPLLPVGVVETSVLQPARPRASNAARA
jgi:hypothetical protein